MTGRWWLPALLGVLLVGCAPGAAAPQPLVAAAQPVATVTTDGGTVSQTATAVPTAITPATPAPPAAPTAVPTATPTPTPTASPTPTVTPTATPVPLCTDRIPAQDDLLTIVTRDYALSRDYAPRDLVPLSDYFPHAVTLGFPSQIRAVLVEPLQELVAAMQADGLRPTLISGYRSYEQQRIAWNKWTSRYDYGAILSALPGTSEHQLGTTVDFGSPELDNEFHTNFAYTAEGVWLAGNAHRFGFVLSYPRRAQEVTQFFYEPWHFRYVGVDLATQLHEENITLTEWQLANFPPPCIPAE